MTELNNEILAELSLDNSNGVRWGNLGGAFYAVSQSMGEKVFSAQYLASGNFQTNVVTGLDYTITFSGDYIADDPVISYLFSSAILFGTGVARETYFRLTKNGRKVLWQVCMTKIREEGGKANEPNRVTLELKSIGKPILITSV